MPAPSLPDAPTLLDPSAAVTSLRLLGAVLETGSGDQRTAVEITEVEAYEGSADPASHGWKGPTRRNAAMFGPAGRLYCYAMHGHTCCNVVCSPEGTAHAVLIRAGRVIDGGPLARQRREAGRRDGAAPLPEAHLARGPGCLTRALGITLGMGGCDVFSPDSPVRLVIPGRLSGVVDREILAGPRVGVPRAHEDPLRFFFAGDPTVSAPLRRAAGPVDPELMRRALRESPSSAA